MRLNLIMFLLLLQLLVDLVNRQHFVRRLQVDSYHVHVCLLEGGLQVRQLVVAIIASVEVHVGS